MATTAALSMWCYVQLVLVSYQSAEARANDRPRGNLSDLYPRWLGARELLLHHRDPYGDDVTREIQAGYYGRVLEPTRPNDPKDQQAFAYPVYVAFLLAPTVEMPFPVAQGMFFWLFAALTAASVLLWLHALGWRISSTALAVWILLTLSCFPAIQGIKLQQLSMFVAALIAASMFALARRRFVLTGILLALATIKPQLIALPVLWLCIWVMGDWRTRRLALWSFAITLAVLVAAGEILLPGWIHEFRAGLAAYYEYTGGGKSVLDVALTPIGGRIVSALLVGVLALVTWQSRRADERSVEFQWSFALSLAITLAVIPMFAPYNQLLLLPALMVISRSVRELWAKNHLSRFLVAITALAVFFQWIAAACLVIALLFLPSSTVQKAWGLPFYPSFAIPITILALLLFTRRILNGKDSDQRLASSDGGAVLG
ncbi:MAG TPA: glycosyltransferase family 87 protein [Candidatus Sulfotelmatobacter sp.]|nr:glycosyltransferase family 87 protein [Candidatus Sulfotelmatobacter sp.]